MKKTRERKKRYCGVCGKELKDYDPGQAFCKNSVCRKKVQQMSKYGRTYFIGKV